MREATTYLRSRTVRAAARRTRLLWLVAVGVLYALLVAMSWRYADAVVTQEAQAEAAISQKEAEMQARTLASTIATNLRHLHGVASVIASDKDVVRAASMTTAADDEMNARLRQFSSDLNVGVVWFLNANGLCVAASNAGNPESFVGVHYHDRSYFIAARAGQRGFQFAVGRKSNIPGLFFSAPIKRGDQFTGAVILKIDLPTVPWVKQTNGYLFDGHGVVILASDQTLERKRIDAGASLHSLTDDERQAIYKQKGFDLIPRKPASKRWSSFAGVVQSAQQPSVLATARSVVPGYGLGVVVERELLIATQFEKRRQASFLQVLMAVTSTFAIALTVMSHLIARRRVANLLRTLAFSDPLTGLVNRHLLNDRLDHATKMSTRDGEFGAVLYIDLDNFKEVNDQAGHQAGDELLKAVASRLSACVRSVDTVARLGGDEFVVHLERLAMDVAAARAAAQGVAEKICTRLNDEHLVHDAKGRVRQFVCSPSIGIAVYGPHADIAHVCREADAAMYRAKKAGKNRVAIAPPAIEHGATALPGVDQCEEVHHA